MNLLSQNERAFFSRVFGVSEIFAESQVELPLRTIPFAFVHIGQPMDETERDLAAKIAASICPDSSSFIWLETHSRADLPTLFHTNGIQPKVVFVFDDAHAEAAPLIHELYTVLPGLSAIAKHADLKKLVWRELKKYLVRT